MAEDLPRRSAVPGPSAALASAANCRTAVIAHHDCDTAIAHRLRAGDHCSSRSMPPSVDRRRGSDRSSR